MTWSDFGSAALNNTLCDGEGVGLTCTDAPLIAVAKKAIERKTGARGLRSIVEAILLDTMFDLPDLTDVVEVVVDKDVVEGRKQPVRVYADKAKEAGDRSEEHTSELQSLMRISYAVFCLTKKKKQTIKA